VRVPILAGEPILARKLGETGGLSSLVPGGYRAYLLAVPRGSGAGFLPGFLPGAGDRVDVIATFPAEVFGEATSITILRSTEVARGPGPPRPQSGSREGSLGRLAEGSGLEAIGEGKLTIPLLVTPEEAERLAMAEALGRITVTLAPQAPEEAEGQGASSGPLVSRNLVRR
ncbi:MAG: RcpC/CpaB family pilus assembly protein, partial [Candidatus Methylomirabilales bacterium]